MMPKAHTAFCTILALQESSVNGLLTIRFSTEIVPEAYKSLFIENK